MKDLKVFNIIFPTKKGLATDLYKAFFNNEIKTNIFLKGWSDKIPFLLNLVYPKTNNLGFAN